MIHIMDTITTVDEMSAASLAAIRAGRTVGFVPTMGYLHEGHLSLARAARVENDIVVASIFVNPTQFGPHEDLARYPHDIAGDTEKLISEGVDILFAPSAAEMYPPGSRTFVEVDGLSGLLCGESRPGHFKGVATVVAKLFNIVRPTRAYFGAKDYQQTVVIRRMAADLRTGVDVEVLPTVRETDGLAMSSRNSYLKPAERKAAAGVYRALSAAVALRNAGVTDAGRLKDEALRALGAEPTVAVEYVSVVHPEDLTMLDDVSSGAVMAVAVRVGGTRLIDNIAL